MSPHSLAHLLAVMTSIITAAAFLSSKGSLNERRRALVRLAFSRFDRDGSGSVDLRDIARCVPLCVCLSVCLSV